MKKNTKSKILGLYDLALAIGAIYIGISMIKSQNGVYAEYPKEWLYKLPYRNWIDIGITSIVVFGLGNAIAGILSFLKKDNKAWIASAIMGVVLLVSVIVHVTILGEWYLALSEFLIFSIIQICFCIYLFVGYKKISNL